VKVLITIGAVVGAVLATAGGATAAETQLPLPDVTVTAPGPTDTPPYLRDQWNSFGRNPYMGSFRVKEDKFTRVPCTAPALPQPTTAATCLQGYKPEPGLHAAGFQPCDLSLDVTMFENAQVSVEADILIFDPYKVSATGSVTSHCAVIGYLNYNVDDFADMNQVTRRGINFRNLVGAGDDKSIEFTVDNHYCKGIRHTGPRWQSGYIYIGHISICRKDAAQVQAEDVAYVFNTLRYRIHESDNNLRGADANSAPVAPLPSDPNAPPRLR
jgi:hypothetical protein